MSNFSLLETILFKPDKEFYLLEGHLKRLQNSIQNFKNLNSNFFPTEILNEDLVDKLKSTVPRDNKYQRVRLLVSTDSEINIEYISIPEPEFSFESLEEAAIHKAQLNVVLDTVPLNVNRSNPFIFNKTTKRDIYEESRKRNHCSYFATPEKPFDVILYNQNNEITETSIANIAVRFMINGLPIWKTPKTKCGLLPGVFRSYLLENQEENNLVEDVITIDDLLDAQKKNLPIVCFNSVRKAYRVELLTV